jgi:hypothetical protein
MAKCQELMKNLKAQMTGKDAKDISGDDLRKDAQSALKEQLGDQMSACMEEAAGDTAKITECRTTLAKASMKQASFDGKEPSKADIQGMLKSAGKKKANDVMKDCDGTREECMTLTKERVAKSMGKASVSTKDAELFNKAGALSAMKDSAKACMEAKKDNASSSCDDPYDQYLEARKMSKPTSAAAQRAGKSRLMVKAQESQVKENLESAMLRKISRQWMHA